MRALFLLLALSACASGRVARLEADLVQVRAETQATCIRLEEYQRAQHGRVTHPCHPQPASATLTPVYMHGVVPPQ